MKIIFRAPSGLLQTMNQDLRRAHPFAFERVGWISVKPAMAGDSLVILADEYHRVPDEHYVDDPRVGAMLGQVAIADALNIALKRGVGMFHVHIHDHAGRPKFSQVDTREQARFVPDFFAVQRRVPHGAVVFSKDSASGRVWLGPRDVRSMTEFHAVGAPSGFQIGSFLRRRGLFV